MTSSVDPIALCAMEVTTNGAAADIRINDIPVATVGMPTGHGQGFIPVSSEIVRGANQLSARVVSVPDPPMAGAKVEIRIALMREGDRYFSNAGRDLVRLDWVAVPGQNMLSKDFAADFGPAQWSWSRCAPWPTPAAALDDAMPFVRDLVAAYFSSEADWFEQASTAQYADMIVAFPALSEAEQKEQIATAIRSDPPEAVPPLPQPRPVLCCHNRLLLLQAPEGGAWLRKRGPGARGSGDQSLLGKVDGRWQIIR